MKELYCEKSYCAEKLCSECYYKDSTKQKLHREDGPAKIEYYRNGNIEHEEYYKDGVLHREDGPVQTSYYEMGSDRKQSERYLIRDSEGEIIDDIFIAYYSNGNVEYESHSKGNNDHRENGPARIWYREDGSKECEKYFIEDKLHREDGPASTQYYENGSKECEKYFIEDKLHREDGPAVIWYDEDGVKQDIEYYIDGEKYNAEDIKNNIEKNKQNIICDKSYDRNINDFIGRTVRHFKGNEYLVLCTALNTESDEIMVIYKALYGENITYARPLKMFMEEVPANKENPTGQKYRFQLAYL
jgi:antitoxin component YwqK of YwqJK toxin-antitoxin module